MATTTTQDTSAPDATTNTALNSSPDLDIQRVQFKLNLYYSFGIFFAISSFIITILFNPISYFAPFFITSIHGIVIGSLQLSRRNSKRRQAIQLPTDSDSDVETTNLHNIHSVFKYATYSARTSSLPLLAQTWAITSVFTLAFFWFFSTLGAFLSATLFSWMGPALLAHAVWILLSLATFSFGAVTVIALRARLRWAKEAVNEGTV